MHKDFVIVLILLLVTRAFGAQTSPDDDKDVPACIGDQRTVLNIIWSCLTTIFACTWLAVHPNVPGRNITRKGAISCAIERAKIMVITILAPEVIVAWAAEQFIVAWKLHHGRYRAITSATQPLTEQKEESKLTLAHGFLLSMGGFYYTAEYEIPYQAPDAYQAASTRLSSILPWSASDYLLDHNGFQDPQFPPHYTPTWETFYVPGTLVTLKVLEYEPNLVTNLAAISPETIEDKSKGDALSKTISILQISWFIVQCIARALQHLPITLLEMTALAFAGLSIITYSLWWHKPLNVKYHISLDGSDCRLWSETNDPEQSTSPVSRSWPERAFYTLDSLFYWIMDTTLGAPVGEFGEDIGYGALRCNSGTTEEFSKRYLTMVCVGSLFGAFHCAAWSFYFPSHAEMVLWRFASTAVLIGLFIGGNYNSIGLIAGLVNREWLSKLDRTFNVPWKDTKPWVKILNLIYLLMMLVGIVAYIVARIMLIILAFLQLRSLPPFAFCTVQWTTYIPHI
ncbi:hypothetical protein EDD85DRAFT_1026871 [Armillaria nabsnona]|nr:hypothetical protein EDD85DRAFT_1026871 [Armillaria nabsnona]